MSVVTDIMATYRGPRRVFRRILAAGPREDRALAVLMAGCVVFFVSSWPGLARKAELGGEDLNRLLGGALFAWLFLMPLVLYLLAQVSHWLLRATGGQGQPYDARVGLFWSLLATAPLLLMTGLVAGFIGEGPALSAVGALWFGVFLWFWFSGLAEARRAGAREGAA